MTHAIHHEPQVHVTEHRKQLAPGIHDAFHEFSRLVFADGALDRKNARSALALEAAGNVDGRQSA